LSAAAAVFLGSALTSLSESLSYAQSISINPVSDHTLGTAPFTIAASASSGLRVTLTSNTTNVCTLSGNRVSLANTGTCSITGTQPGDSYYSAAASVTRSFNVLPAAKIPQSGRSLGQSNARGRL